MPDVETPQFEPAADRAAQAERDIQAPLDAKEERSFKEKGEQKETPAMQAGARPYPAPPFPEQHQVKPGIEARLTPPRCTTRRSTRARASWRARSP
jgi:hypothetical protein